MPLLALGSVEHPDVVIGAFTGSFVANIFMVIIGLFGICLLVQVLRMPKGTPKEIKDFWKKALKNANEEKIYRDMLSKLGDMPTWYGSAEFSTHFNKDDADLLSVIKNLGLYHKHVKK